MSTPSGPPAVELRNVTKAFGERRPPDADKFGH